MKFFKRFLSVLLFLFLITAQSFADESNNINDRLNDIDRLFSFYGTNPNMAINTVVDIDPAGIKFEAKSMPEFRSLLAFEKVTIAYSKQSIDGSRLKINFGGSIIKSGAISLLVGGRTIIVDDLCDWLLLPIVMYVDSGINNCVTMSGKPKNIMREDGTTEIDRNAFDNLKTQVYGKKNVYWMEYHPAFVNTLAGFNLFLVDAMLLDLDLRTVTNNIGIIKGYNDKYIFNKNASDLSIEKISTRMVIDGAKARNSRTILMQNELIPKFKDKGVNINSDTIEFISKYWFDKTYHSYIFTDCYKSNEGNTIKLYGDMPFRIEKIPNSELYNIIFTGKPYYKFQKQTNDSVVNSYLYGKNPVYEPVDDLTNVFREDTDLFKNLNPVVFNTAEKIAQWAAFFRYAKENNPEGWKIFIEQIKPVAYYTAADGSDIPQYHYKIDPIYDCKTPRCFDLLKKRFGKEVENEYARFVNSRRMNVAVRAKQTVSGDNTVMGKKLSVKIAEDGKPVGVLLDYMARALERMANISHFQILDDGVLIIGEKSSSADESAEKVEWVKTAIKSIFFYEPENENNKGPGVSIDSPPLDKKYLSSESFLKNYDPRLRNEIIENINQFYLNLSSLSISQYNRLSNEEKNEIKMYLSNVNIFIIDGLYNDKKTDWNNILYINSELIPQNTRFIGGNENTDYGYIFFEADRLMKCMAAGRDNINNDIIYTSKTVKDIKGFKNLFEIEKVLNIDTGYNARFWFTPKYELYNEGNNYYIKGTVIVNNAEKYADDGTPPHKVTENFADFMTKNYDLFCREYPVFKKLQQVAEITALIQILKERGVNMKLYGNISIQERKTPATTPTISNPEVTYTDINGPITGGVDFNFNKRGFMEVKKEGLDTAHKELIAKASAGLLEDLAEYSAEFQYGDKTYVSTYLPTNNNNVKTVTPLTFLQKLFNKY